VSAATDVAVYMTFVETAVDPGCAATDGACGTGSVDPFGRGRETIQFGAGCNGGCDLRNVYLPGGSLIFAERSSDGTCPGPTGLPCRPS